MAEILVVGLNHRTAPVEIREGVAVRDAELAGLLQSLCAGSGVQEAVVLSTCNRSEIYVATEEAESARRFLTDHFARRCPGSLNPDEHLYTMRQPDSVEHLFRVVASLDSMVVGEAQIQGQVKEAYRRAAEAGSAGNALNPLFQKALSVAKRIRTETGIAKTPVSVSHIAVHLAERILGHLERRRVMILGSGKMAELLAKHLLDHGLRSILVANRTYARAVALAERFGGKPVRFDDLYGEAAGVDILIASTGAPHTLIGRAEAEAILKARRNRPIVLIDIAVPRDIAPEVNELDNCFLYDIDDLQEAADENLGQRRAEVDKGLAIVREEARAFGDWQRSRDVGPVIQQLRGQFQDVIDAESERLFGVLPDLSPDQRKQVQQFAYRVMNKMLHPQLKQLRSAADPNHQQDLIRAVCELYGIDPDQAPERAAAPATGGGASDAPKKRNPFSARTPER